MSNEFEDRERELANNDPIDQLGELSPTHLTERGEFRHFRGEPNVTPPLARPIGEARPAGIPPDIATENRVQSMPGETGSPGIPAVVTSAFDTRPINGRDFTAQDVGNLTLPAAAAQTVSVSYTVPDGFVSILRGFAFYPSILADVSINNQINHMDWDGILVTISVENIVQPGYNEMRFLQQSKKFQPTHILANGGQTIKMDITYSEDYIDNTYQHSDYPIGVTVEEVPIYMFLYGNDLQTRGLPLNFEVASQIRSGSLK